MKTSESQQRKDLPFPDSGFLPGLQRTIKHKLEKGEIDEVDADVFYGNMGCIVEEKGDEKRWNSTETM